MFERFRAFPPGRQIQLAALGVILIGGLLIAAWYLYLNTPYQPLFTNLRTTDAATIVANLEQKKIPYRLGRGGTTILVPADRVDAVRLNVMTEDLPLKGTVGFELFNKSDMGLTDFAQKINYQRALQGELARTIMTLDGVDTARVHLSLGEDRIFRDDRVPPKASVTVRMEHGATLSQEAAQGIQRLVAAAVPQLEIANVVILDEEGRAISPPPQTALMAEPVPPIAQQKNDMSAIGSAQSADADSASNAPASSMPDEDWLLEVGFTLLLLLFVLAGIFLLLRQLRARRLTEKQRAEFVNKLRLVLQQGDDRVTSRP